MPYLYKYTTILEVLKLYQWYYSILFKKNLSFLKCCPVTLYKTLLFYTLQCISVQSTLNPVHMSLLCDGRKSTETSASSSFQRVQTVRIRPSVSAWENTKAAPALLSGRPRRAMSQPRPREWSASFRSSSGIIT